jgi:hypothetical protein
MHRHLNVAAVFMFASWQLFGCGPDESNPEVSNESAPEVGLMNTSTNEFCTGESTHTVDMATGLVTWRFKTTNTGHTRRIARVIGRVYHPATGGYLESVKSDSVIENTCEINTTTNSGYTSSVGQHRCCMRKRLIGGWTCREPPPPILSDSKQLGQGCPLPWRVLSKGKQAQDSRGCMLSGCCMPCLLAPV